MVKTRVICSPSTTEITCFIFFRAMSSSNTFAGSFLVKTCVINVEMSSQGRGLSPTRPASYAAAAASPVRIVKDEWSKVGGQRPKHTVPQGTGSKVLAQSHKVVVPPPNGPQPRTYVPQVRVLKSYDRFLDTTVAEKAGEWNLQQSLFYTKVRCTSFDFAIFGFSYC